MRVNRIEGASPHVWSGKQPFTRRLPCPKGGCGATGRRRLNRRVRVGEGAVHTPPAVPKGRTRDAVQSATPSSRFGWVSSRSPVACPAQRAEAGRRGVGDSIVAFGLGKEPFTRRLPYSKGGRGTPERRRLNRRVRVGEGAVH